MQVLMISTDRKIFEPESEVARRMKQYGEVIGELKIIVFTTQKPQFEIQQISPRVTVYPTNSWHKLFYIWDAIGIAKKIVKKQKKCPTWVSAQDPFECGLAAFIIARKANSRLQLQLHTDFLNPYFTRGSRLNWLRKWLGKILLARADRVRVVSRTIQASLLKQQLVLARKIFVLPVFIDFSAAQKVIQTSLKDKYPQFDFIILMASRLTKEKNYDLAIEAVRMVVLKWGKVGLVIVGEGPEKDHILSQIKEKSLSNNVVCEPWTNDLFSYLRTANLFLLTSWYEGYGRTLLEAVASACPIITTPVGIATEIIDGTDGFVCPFEARTIAAQIETLLKDRKMLEQMSASALQKANEFPTRAQYLEAYKKMWL